MPVDDVDPRLSKFILAYAFLGAVLNLAASIRARGVVRSLVLLALGTGLPAAGELLATGPLGLLRHRTQPRGAGVPFAIVLGWYNVIHGSYAIAERTLSSSPSGRGTKGTVLPPAAALVGASLDLVLDPAGLDVGLWEWTGDGPYAREIEGANGKAGVPAINYVGWLALVAGATLAYERLYGRESAVQASRLPVLLMLPLYLAAAAWAVKSRRPRYLLYSLPFPVALYAGLKKG